MRVEREWWEEPARSNGARPTTSPHRSPRPDSEPSDELRDLARRLETRDASVAIVGMGYVGLPLLVSAREAGFRALGLESDPKRLLALRTGRSYVEDVSDEELQKGDAEFDNDPALLDRADVIVICVPTPLADKVPDLSFVRAAAEMIGDRLRSGMAVILESTTYPGTTEDVVKPILESRSGLLAGSDFALGYSPERVNPGQNVHGVANTPKLVSGITDGCRDLIAAFYGSFVEEVVTTTSPREAEMAKLIENTFRQVNIALVNELAIASAQLDVDVWEAIRAAGTKPFGYMPFWPGPGVGGHCISIDPSYLTWQVREKSGLEMALIEHANTINRGMPAYVVSRVRALLRESGTTVRSSRILVMGASYKPGVGDQRESPAVEVIRRLTQLGADLDYHDAFVPELKIAQRTLVSQEATKELVSEADVVVILTAHKGVDYEAIVRDARVVFDAQGVTIGIDATNVDRL